MPHFKELLDPNYLSNIDFLNDKMRYEKKIVTITDVKKEQVHDGKSKRNEPETVAALHFKECKPLILSNRNFKTILQMTKRINTDDWKGIVIELHILENQKAFGQMWDVVRVSTYLPQIRPSVDYSQQIAMLKECKTIEDLATVYKSLTKDQQAGCFQVKEECKTALTPIAL